METSIFGAMRMGILGFSAARRQRRLREVGIVNRIPGKGNAQMVYQA